MAEAGNTLFGTLEQFQPGPSASFTRYVERVRIYLRANGVDDPVRQRDIFLTGMLRQIGRFAATSFSSRCCFRRAD